MHFFEPHASVGTALHRAGFVRERAGIVEGKPHQLREPYLLVVRLQY